MTNLSSKPQAPIVSTRNVSVRFPVGRGRVLTAVDDVSIEIHRGETFGLIGESGSGKSTIGRAIVCLERPSEGTILHDGRDPHALRASELRRHRRQYQIIFQDPNAALDPRMTILKSIREPLDVAGENSRADRDQRARDLMNRVGLGEGFADLYPHQLSGGQKQRACIARALTVRPSLIVCDEAVAALDVSIQADILNLLAELQQEFGLTYLFITHNIGVVEHISDTIAVMYLGQIIEIAPADRLAEHFLHPYTQALLSAEPVALPSGVRPDHRIVLEGELPSPMDPPTGCRFRTRCRFATGICAAEAPKLRELAPDHQTACHHAETFRLDPNLKEASR
ncbi:ATP-binding cassette domain-containing protein (plasmid) [Ponticoccus alexandrii]|uniref:ATP-binding cassette domain-containing protein n=1 Tax=Ponticoccus alexandrii TaxID=1943633 RepID=A0ABX7FFS9_9RHOB|nr:peptide ABC transporter ATP-binding protein [Rhodobacteraceae bacterium PD-2]QRF68782.1 ATP-binding cassette domain-containing protein [Ponticoccus alexandrii]